MGFTLGCLFEASLLVVNALAVLQDYSPNLKHDEPPLPRFLAHVGWTADAVQDTGFGGEETIKHRIIKVINAVRTLLRVPLIGINILAVVYLLLIG